MLLESNILELKREYTDDIKKTVTAFANSDGGKLLIGITDDGSVIGLDKVDDTLLRVSNVIREAIHPDLTMFISLEVILMQEKEVIQIEVQRGTARPYYLAGKGIRPEGVYVRQGASTVPASETAILKMIRETSGDSYEEARSLHQELTFGYTKQFFAENNLELVEQHKRTLGLLGRDGAYTNLGLLLSDQCKHGIKVAVFEGTTKTIFKDRLECKGSLLKQLEEAYLYIDRHNRTRAEFKGLVREESRDYPVTAIREALLNALVHRDYSFSADTLIALYDDRIEFVSIGGLIRGISYADIMLGVSVLRNAKLANIFYRLRLIEAYGTGIQKMLSSYKEFSKRPNIETSDNAFRITLPNTNFNEYKSETNQIFVKEDTETSIREEEVLRLLKTKPYLIRKDIENALDISQSTAILLLRKMVNQGLLLSSGAGKKIKYFKKANG